MCDLVVVSKCCGMAVQPESAAFSACKHNMYHCLVRTGFSDGTVISWHAQLLAACIFARVERLFVVLFKPFVAASCANKFISSMTGGFQSA